jgi:hypothetical protein
MPKLNYTWVAITAWTAGVAALLCEHFHTSQLMTVLARTTFGIISCAAIGCVVLNKLRAPTGTSEPEVSLFIRVLSRWVYILLYALALVRLCLYWYDVSQLSAHSHFIKAVGSPRPIDDFQVYVGLVVTPLWLIRAIILVRSNGMFYDHSR